MQLKKFSLLIFFVLTAISIFRLLRFVRNTSSTASPPVAHSSSVAKSCTSPSNRCRKKLPSQQLSADYPLNLHPGSSTTGALTEKEFQLLANLTSLKAPSNMLIFGLGPQSLQLSLLNTGGHTIILEDEDAKIQTTSPTSRAPSAHIYKVEHGMPAREAYDLLKQARKDPSCKPRIEPLRKSRCPLALRSLPEEVHGKKWDLVVIDGPSGDRPEAPGRMAVIYSAGILARMGNATDVVVHDIDRTIEKWYSWEYLCEDNLLSSKGKLWHFRITNGSKSSSFCPTKFHTASSNSNLFAGKATNSSVLVRQGEGKPL